MASKLGVDLPPEQEEISEGMAWEVRTLEEESMEQKFGGDKDEQES
jgi:hypothetical protein